jgi:tRNA nucleotidyltransferase (CCA-adding enzyme)
LTLYQNGLPFVRFEDFHPSQVEQVILVDTQRMLEVDGVKDDTPVLIIEHHPQMRDMNPHETFTGETVGATATLLVEQLQQQGLTLTTLEATLLALGVYEDTGSLTYGTTTARDILAAAWLLQHGVVLDTVRRFLTPPLNMEQQALYEVLLERAESRTVQGYSVIVTAAASDEYIAEINAVAHRLRDTLDPSALFAAVSMGSKVLLVCRSTTDEIDVGEIARVFGGGGHGRAAAATIRDKMLEEIIPQVWEEAYRRIQPAVLVADLMSHSANTIDPEKRLGDVIASMRRVGHEGYPVVENGRVIGLLTRRDADKAAEHDLLNMRVREVMMPGEVVLSPADSIAALEQLMVSSGWGQIPVVDAEKRIIGIVTRTDLIKFWARTHPTTRPVEPRFTLDQIGESLGKPIQRLIGAITDQAAKQTLSLYMVGGVVRDLLVKRPNYDIDFVVEGDAIAFSETLRAQYGGEITHFRAFGTAKWTLDEQVSRALGIVDAELPHHVDFASARFEFYEHPTALPTVYNSSIKLDLQRRDFTINAMALELYPQFGKLLDVYGGQADLEGKQIHVLHSLSFVDDPTRILRAVRFAHRLGFQIDPRTQTMMETAVPLLRRVTGERVRAELTLLLSEREPEKGFSDLQRRGVLVAIHPSFMIDESLLHRVLPLLRASERDKAELLDISWCVVMSTISADQIEELCERLMMGREITEACVQVSRLSHLPNLLSDPSARPSQLVLQLERVSAVALHALDLILTDKTAKTHLNRYVTTWTQIKPLTNGHDLKARGLTPGPRYKVILDRLRAAWLDGDVHSAGEEQALLDSLIAGQNES